jgi:hypothetical protein
LIIRDEKREKMAGAGEQARALSQLNPAKAGNRF